MEQLLNFAEFALSNCSIETIDEHHILMKSAREGGRLILSGPIGRVGGIDWTKARYIVLDVLNL